MSNEDQFPAELRNRCPVVGETFEHLGITYECTVVELYPDDQEIHATWKRKFDAPEIRLDPVQIPTRPINDSPQA